MSKHNPEFNLKLAVLDCIRPPELVLTQTQIAGICGVSRSNIHRIEHQAIKKLRIRFGKQVDFSPSVSSVKSVAKKPL